MKYLKIRVDNVDLDFQVVPEKFFFTYSIKGLEDFTKVGGALTERSIKIPATNKNDLVFDKWWDAIGDNEEAANFKTITIDDGGEFVFQGQCVLKKVELYGDHYGLRGKFYSIACYANNTDFIINLQGRLMKDLSKLPQGLVYNDLNITTGLAANPALSWCTGFIKYGNWAVAGEVQAYEATFLLFLRQLIINVFNDLGYNVESNFLQTEEFKRYCMPLIPFAEAPETYARYWGNVRCSNAAGLIAGLGETPIIFDTVDVDAIGFSPYNTTTGEYTAEFDGYYAFEIIINVKSNNAGVDFAIQGRINNIIPSSYNVFYDYQNAGAVERFTAVIGVDLQAGDTFTFYTGQELQQFEYEKVSLRCEVNDVQPQEGYPVICEELLRDYKQSDFIAGVQHLFNLNIEANSFSRVVTIEPADNYTSLTDSGAGEESQVGFFNATDREKQIDTLPTSYETSESTKLQKQIKYTFKVNDATSEALDDAAPIGYSDGVFSFDGDRYKEGTKTIENPFFHKTPLLFDEEARATQSQNTPFFPLLWPANYFEDKSPAFNYSNTAPRIFYARGFFDGSTRINLNLFTNPTIARAYNQLFMVDYSQYLTGAPSLSFSNVTVGGVELKGLIERYYLPELKRMQVGKMLETWVFWRGLDMTNLTFRNKLYIQGALWIVQKIINYDPTTSASTKTQMLLAAPVEDGDQNQIINSDILPVLTTEGQPE